MSSSSRRWSIRKDFKKRTKGPRLNRQIRINECRLVGEDGTAYGVVSMREAIDIAYDKSLDLVEVSPNAKPPVVKLIDYGKFKYSQQKSANLQKKKQATTQLKEVQFRPNIEANDLETKMKKVRQFLNQADKIKLVMIFRGREMAYKDAGLEKFKVLIEDICKEGATVENEPKFMGRRIITIVAPSVKLLNKIKQQKKIEAKKEKEREREKEKSKIKNTET